MNLHKFYPVQEPQPEELDEAFLDTATNLIYRLSPILQPGIVPAASIAAVTGDSRFTTLGEFPMTSDPGATAGDTGAFMLYIGAGMAFGRHPINDPDEQPYDHTNPFDIKLERIFISPANLLPYNAAAPSRLDVLGNPIPQSTGSNGILLAPIDEYGDRGITAAGADFYVYITHLPTVDTLTDDPSNPGNKYTINPLSGQLNYVHLVDGYRIHFYRDTQSVEPSDVFLGRVHCTPVGIAYVDISGREYAYVPSAIVRSRVSSDLYPGNYTIDSQVSMTDHVNAVANASLVSPSNPHGMAITNIPGATGSSIYDNHPADFHANGIVEPAGATAGSFFSVAGSSEGIPAAVLTPPTVGGMYIANKRFDNTSFYWCEGVSGTALVPREILAAGQQTLVAQFPSAAPLLRPAGLYLVYGEIYAHPDDPGMIVKADQITGATLGQIVDDPAAYLTNPAMQSPIAVCSWNGTNFNIMVDPQTGYTAGDYRMIDVRQHGTVASEQLLTNRRFYPGATGPARNTVDLRRDIRVVGTLSATKLEGDGAGIYNLQPKAWAQKSTTRAYTVSGSSTWESLPFFTLGITTSGAPICLSWSCEVLSTTSNNVIGFDVQVDGYLPLGDAADYGLLRIATVAAWRVYRGAFTHIHPLLAGPHTITLRWRQAATESQMYVNSISQGGFSTFSVREL